VSIASTVRTGVDLLTREHVFSYVMSVLLKRIFMFKCILPMLRLTTVLALMSLPLSITHLVCFHKRVRPPSSSLVPTVDAIVLGMFPIAWFFGFLYYTEVPSLVFVVWTVVAASQDRHWLAALVRLYLPQSFPDRAAN
jgi:alpha-1,2-glucosyltransferase